MGWTLNPGNLPTSKVSLSQANSFSLVIFYENHLF